MDRTLKGVMSFHKTMVYLISVRPFSIKSTKHTVKILQPKSGTKLTYIEFEKMGF
jgi:hypothetical protein